MIECKKCGRDVSELMARMCLQVGCPAKLSAERLGNEDTSLGIDTLLSTMTIASPSNDGFSPPADTVAGLGGEGSGGGASSSYDSCSDSSSSSSSSDCGSTDT